jgi:hypothetical protein
VVDFLVNVMPFLVHVPSWMPGTGWKQVAKEWREQKDSVIEETYQWTRTQMVSSLSNRFSLTSNAIDIVYRPKGPLAHQLSGR